MAPFRIQRIPDRAMLPTRPLLLPPTRELKRGVFLLGLLVAIGCGAPPRPGRGPEPQPEYRRLERKDPGTGNVLQSWVLVVYPDGRAVKHGDERRWYANGARRSEASFRFGEPEGELVYWYETGRRRSEYHYDPEGGPTTMSFWHENGQLAGEGPARRGVRNGLWTFWHEDGKLRERGGYIAGAREGIWTLYYPDGTVRSRGSFAKGERSGPWDHYEPGERFEPE